MKILITGGAGFIGSFLADRLITLGHQVRIFDNLDEQVHPEGRVPLYLNKAAEFIKGDIRDYDAFRNAVRDTEAVFHEAAAVGLSQSLYEIKKYADVNIGGTANLLNILANEKHKVKKIIMPGSMSSYGEGLYECGQCGRVRPSPRSNEQMERGIWDIACPACRGKIAPLPTAEENALNGTFIYSLTKKTQEEMGLIFGKTYGVPVTVLRYFSGYGPRQALSNPYTGVVAIFLSRLLNNKPPLIYEDGCQMRDYISVHDIVSANIAVLNAPKSNFKVYNVGSGNPVSILELADRLAQIVNPKIKPQIAGHYRKGDIRHCYADTSLIKNELNWRPEVAFEEGIRELINWSKGEKAVDRFMYAFEVLKKRGLRRTPSNTRY